MDYVQFMVFKNVLKAFKKGVSSCGIFLCWDGACKVSQRKY